MVNDTERSTSSKYKLKFLNFYCLHKDQINLFFLSLLYIPFWDFGVCPNFCAFLFFSLTGQNKTHFFLMLKEDDIVEHQSSNSCVIIRKKKIIIIIIQILMRTILTSLLPLFCYRIYDRRHGDLFAF